MDECSPEYFRVGVPGSLPGCLFAGDRLTASSPPALLRIRIPFRDLIVPEPGIPSVDMYVCVSGHNKYLYNHPIGSSKDIPIGERRDP